MNIFRKEIIPPAPANIISHHHKLLHIGSCFSEHIGNRFGEHGMQSLVNPFGQQYNPGSISQAIMRIIKGDIYGESDLFFHNELYHSFDHHSSFSGSDAKTVVKNINNKLSEAATFLKHAEWLFITPGTAHYFRLKETGKIVSNCHKIPAGKFDRAMAGADDIYHDFAQAIEHIYGVNPSINIVFTVSPVRYFAFGEHENTVSKSMLFAAMNRLQQHFSNIYYFPSYELVIDDLRDYRFYEKDMIHPNAPAIDYVWEKIKTTMCSSDCVALFDKVAAIRSACNHRPVNRGSTAHREFLQKIRKQVEQLENQYAYLDLSEEKKKLDEGSMPFSESK